MTSGRLKRIFAVSAVAVLSVFPSCATHVHAKLSVDSFGSVSPWLAEVGEIEVAPYQGPFFSSGGLLMLDTPQLSPSFHLELQTELARAIEAAGGASGVAGAEALEIVIERCSLEWNSGGFGIQAHATVQLFASKGRDQRRMSVRVHGEDVGSSSVVRLASSAEPQLARALHQCVGRLLSSLPSKVAVGDEASRPPLYEPKEQRRRRGYATGTGFFVTDSGHVLTNYHVIEGAEAVTITRSDGVEFEAAVIATDEANDVALLKVDVVTRPLLLASGGPPRKGAEVFTLGYPRVQIQGNEQKATFGRVNAESGIRGDARFLQVDVPIQPGNSGGPLLDRRGRVVGITTMTLNGLKALRESGALPQNVNYALKAAYASPLVTQHVGSLGTSSRGAPSSYEDLIDDLEPSVVLIVAK